MLTAAHRLRAAAEFTATTRHGYRVAERHLVAHFYLPAGAGGPAKVGFTVSAAVGGSVVRHRVTRQLRAGCREILADLPAGSRLVVWARPEAAQAPPVVLQRELRSVVLAALAQFATQ